MNTKIGKKKSQNVLRLFSLIFPPFWGENGFQHQRCGHQFGQSILYIYIYVYYFSLSLFLSCSQPLTLVSICPIFLSSLALCSSFYLPALFCPWKLQISSCSSPPSLPVSLTVSLPPSSSLFLSFCFFHCSFFRSFLFSFFLFLSVFLFLFFSLSLSLSLYFSPSLALSAKQVPPEYSGAIASCTTRLCSTRMQAVFNDDLLPSLSNATAFPCWGILQTVTLQSPDKFLKSNK